MILLTKVLFPFNFLPRRMDLDRYDWKKEPFAALMAVLIAITLFQ